jgi:hypothetical protein
VERVDLAWALLSPFLPTPALGISGGHVDRAEATPYRSRQPQHQPWVSAPPEDPVSQNLRGKQKGNASLGSSLRLGNFGLRSDSRNFNYAFKIILTPGPCRMMLKRKTKRLVPKLFSSAGCRLPRPFLRSPLHSLLGFSATILGPHCSLVQHNVVELSPPPFKAQTWRVDCLGLLSLSA